MKRIEKFIFYLLTSIFCSGSFFIGVSASAAIESDHIVISEIQTGTEENGTQDEFVELYNPTDQAVDLSGWELKKKTSGQEYNLVDNGSFSGVIGPKSFFLIAHKNYKGTTAPDLYYTTENNLAASGNSVVLYGADSKTGLIVDEISYSEIAKGKSLERKALLDGICISAQGEGELLGNGCDLMGIESDFDLRDKPGAQNSKSPAESSLINNTEENNSNAQNENPISASSDDSANNSSGSNVSNSETGNNNTDNPEISGENITQNSPASASSSDALPPILVTELLINPEDDDKDSEFIEIYNSGDKKADLSQWIIEDKEGTIKKFVIPDGTFLESGKYKVFYSSQTGITLNNTQDEVVLKNKNGNHISETPPSGAAGEGMSFALSNGIWSWTLKVTPGNENIIENKEDIKPEIKEEPAPAKKITSETKTTEIRATTETGTKEADKIAGSYDFSDGVMIIAVYPNPPGRDNGDGSYEWVKLHNESDEEINLKGWIIDDMAEKGSRPYVIEEDKIIKPNEYQLFSSSETKLAFNNLEDEVNLYWPDGRIVDNAKYAKAEEGLSYNLDGNVWIWSSEAVFVPEGKDNKTATILEDNENGSTEDEEEEKETEAGRSEEDQGDYIETTVAEAKKMPRFSKVKIIGTVSTPPGVFSDRMFYIAGSGLQVYSYTAEMPQLNLGDKIEISGRMSDVGGEKRLLLDRTGDIRLISENNPLHPVLIRPADATEFYEGSLVEVRGKVAKAENNLFYIDDGSSKIKVYIKSETRIGNYPKEGESVSIVGELSRTSSGYRLLPRYESDIKSLQETETSEHIKAKSGPMGELSLISAIIGVLGIVILVDWGRMKAKK